MRQINLPLVPDAVINLGQSFSVLFEADQVTWFHGLDITCRHRRSDQNQFRMEIARLCAFSDVKQSVMARATGLHANTIMGYVARMLKSGPGSFFSPSPVRSATVLTEERLADCQRRLGEGRSRSQVAAEAGIKKNTLDKAIRDGRLRLPAAAPSAASTPGARATAGREAALHGMGSGCTAVDGRVEASLGALSGMASVFETAQSVLCGGVLCAVPALVASGLYRFLDLLPWPAENASYYYSITHVVTLLAFMALLRIRSPEAVRREDPEEFGRLLGLDRIPEVQCIRRRLRTLAADPKAVSEWTRKLSGLWMSDCPELAGVLYVDGHVRAYYGERAELPRRFFSRLRLCLRGITDWWVNDITGQPFFYVERQTNEGMLAVLRDEIVPRLLREVPGQPADAELAADPSLCRFTLVFDREGYSPAFFREMWVGHRIACITYRKRVSDEWPAEMFRPMQARMGSGAEATLMLASKAVMLPCRDADGKAAGLPVMEVRRLMDSGHQTSIVTTNQKMADLKVAVSIFSRWGQENFFHYMEEEFALDVLAGIRTADIPCGSTVVNPERKSLERERRVIQGKLARKRQELGRLAMPRDAGTAKETEELLLDKASCVEAIQNYEQDSENLKEAVKKLPRRILYADLPEAQKFKGLESTPKLLLDTIRMVAYRAETAMASISSAFLAAPDTVRSWIKALMTATADIIPDCGSKMLNVRIYPLGEERINRMALELFQTLNESETVFQGTDLVMHYSLLGGDEKDATIQNPRAQEL